MLPKVGKKTTYSKRDVAKMGQSANSAKKETAKKKSKIQEKPEKPIQPFWRESTSSSEMGQIPKMPQKEQTAYREQQSEEEENVVQDEKEREVSPEQTVQTKESKGETEEASEKEEMLDKEEIKNAPIKGDVKWEKEKKPTRSSTRNQKKPNWLGNNIMVTIVEPESCTEESLPSVFEIEPPENK